MQLFEGPVFYALLLAAVTPAVFIGASERPLKRYGMAVTLFFVAASMYKSPAAIFWMALFIVIERLIVSVYIRDRKKNGRIAGRYYAALIMSLMPLVIYKLMPFIMPDSPDSGAVSIMGFIGISYMTFRQLQIVIEIYDGLIEEVDTFDYVYFMIFFPSVLSGPIARSREFSADINRIRPSAEYSEMAGEGLVRFMKGMIYKVVLSTFFYQILTFYGIRHDIRSALIYMYMYGFYLFFDFAGYSLMAVGCSYIFGFRMPDNFNKPFVSTDIKEFWDRWHITLSHWLRDYLFSRIVMNMMRHKVFKNKLTIACSALMINMFVMGLWHGLEPYYIIYGIYHGILLAVTEVFQKKSKFYKKHKKDRWFKAVSWFVTFNLVMFGFFIFSGTFTELVMNW